MFSAEGFSVSERLEVVQHLVVDALDHRAQHLLQQLEVQQQPRVVQFRAGQRHAHLVVVPVRILALAVVVAQIVAGGKIRLHGDFVHWRSPVPVRRRRVVEWLARSH